MGKKAEFSAGDYVVYPTHGVGKIVGVEEQEISGHELQLFVIKFETEKMTLRVPIEKATVAGLRKLSSRQQMELALSTLRGRSRVNRAMWSRRAQEYAAKINSGDPISIAEVVRDLHRNAGCIDCGVCEPECPVEAILPDTEGDLDKWVEINRQYSEQWPNITKKGEPPADADDWRDVPDKFEKHFSPKPPENPTDS